MGVLVPGYPVKKDLDNRQRGAYWWDMAKKSRRKFSAEQKQAAVSEYHARKEQGKPIKPLLDRLRLASSVLTTWVQHDAKGTLAGSYANKGKQDKRRTLSKNKHQAPTSTASPASSMMGTMLQAMIDQNAALRGGLEEISALCATAARGK